MSTSEPASSPRSKAEVDEPASGKPLVSQWSQEDIDDFVNATKLCDVCQVMLGPTRLWKPSPHYENAGVLTDGKPRGPFEHHASHESLIHSLHFGCHLCIMFHKQWRSDGMEEFYWSHFRFTSARDPNLSSSKMLWVYAAKAGVKTVFRDGESTRMGYPMAWASCSYVDFSIAKPYIVPPAQARDHLAVARKWADNCQLEGGMHLECEKYRSLPRRKPTRLLYLDPQLPGRVQLITTNNLRDYRYITLSHRWGTADHPQPPKLSINRDVVDTDAGWISVDKLQAGVLQSSFPRTFRDALEIARYCEVEYFWIDCLCIVQDKNDDGKNPEWDKEAVKMGDIYAGGMFNIAAVDAQHCDQGLSPKQSECELLASSPKRLKAEVLYQDSLWGFRARILSSGLLSRGWVCQEVILTPANLFCTDNEMWWSCTHASLSQTFPLESIQGFWGSQARSWIDEIRETKHRMLTPGNNKSRLWKSWHHVLQRYAPTYVTYDEDRLVALQGISDFFRSLYPVQLQQAVYHSGLWSTDIFSQLAWSAREDEAVGRTRQTDQYIPTWSPLSQSVAIFNRTTLDESDDDEKTRLLPNRFLSMDTSHLDRFGRAADWMSCEIHLKGALVNMAMSPPLDSSRYKRCYPTGHQDVLLNAFLDTRKESREHQLLLEAFASGNQIQGLLLAATVQNWGTGSAMISFDGILLQAFTDPDIRPPQIRRWVRVGSFASWWGLKLPIDGITNEASIAKMELAFGIVQNYGIRWELDSPEEGGHDWGLRQVRLHETELEHIVIV